MQWTKKMIEAMKQRYTIDGPVRLAKELGKSLPSVLWKAKCLGLRKNRKAFWTEERDETLRQRYAAEGGHKLAVDLGIDAGSVWTRANWLGLHTKAGLVELGKRRAANNRTCNIHYFDRWTPNNAYAFGFLMADGAVDRRQQHLWVSVASKDESVLRFLQKEMGGRLHHRSKGIDPRGVVFQAQTRLTVCSVLIVKRLVAMGMKPAKTYNDDPFPEVPQSLMGDFVRGVLDGDGCVHIKRLGHCQLTFVSSPKFITGIRDTLVVMVGMRSNKVQILQGKKASWATITWTSLADLRRFHDFTYPAGHGFCLERKKQRLVGWLRNQEERG